MRTDFPQILDECWDEKYTPYSYDFDLWPDWLFQYYNELPLGEYIESAYLTWKSEQHILIPNYEIMSSLVPLVKHYFVTTEDDDNKFKITRKYCNSFLTCKGRSGELLYTTFLHSGFYTLGPYSEELDTEIFHFQWHVRTKIKCMYHKFLKEFNVDNKF